VLDFSNMVLIYFASCPNMHRGLWPRGLLATQKFAPAGRRRKATHARLWRGVARKPIVPSTFAMCSPCFPIRLIQIKLVGISLGPFSAFFTKIDPFMKHYEET